jgi:phage shock protein E
MPIKKITPTEVYRLQQESGAIRIMDVREPGEFAEIRSPLAENIPLSTFNAEELSKDLDLRTPIFLVCRSGARSLKAAQILANKGFQNIYNIEGGMTAWADSGLPVNHG